MADAVVATAPKITLKTDFSLSIIRAQTRDIGAFMSGLNRTPFRKHQSGRNGSVVWDLVANGSDGDGVCFIISTSQRIISLNAHCCYSDSSSQLGDQHRKQQRLMMTTFRPQT